MQPDDLLDRNEDDHLEDGPSFDYRPRVRTENVLELLDVRRRGDAFEFIIQPVDARNAPTEAPETVVIWPGMLDVETVCQEAAMTAAALVGTLARVRAIVAEHLVVAEADYRRWHAHAWRTRIAQGLDKNLDATKAYVTDLPLFSEHKLRIARLEGAASLLSDIVAAAQTRAVTIKEIIRMSGAPGFNPDTGLPVAHPPAVESPDLDMGN